MPQDDEATGLEAGEGFGTESDSERICPEGCDLFTPDPLKVQELRKKGVDPKIAYVRVVKIEGGERVRMPGDYPAEQTSSEWVRLQFGPGTYEITGLNLQYTYVARTKCTLRNGNPAPGGFGMPFGGPPAGGAGFDSNEPIEKMVMRMAVMKLFQTEQDPMRGVMADMMKMLVTQSTMQLQAAQAAALGGNKSSPELMALVEILKVQITANGQKNNGGGGGGKNGATDLLGFLQLGLSLGKQAAGVAGAAAAPEPESMLSKFLETLPDIVDSIGPGLVAVVAQGMLPPDKAQQAMNAIHAHMAAREAEARSQVTTEGVPVG